MNLATFITEEEHGSVENTALMYKDDQNRLIVKLLHGKNLSDNTDCEPCSAARLAEYLNNCKEPHDITLQIKDTNGPS